MQESTDPASQRQGNRKRGHRIITTLLAIGVSLFGYGFAVTIDLLPSGWGFVGVFQYLFLVIGALSISLAGLVTVWIRRRRRAQSLTRRQTLYTGLLAPAIAFGATAVSYWLGVGRLLFPVFLYWTALGLVILGFQFSLGAMKPKRRRRLLLAAESVVVFALTFGFLVIDREHINLVSFVFVSGSASLLLLLLGGPLSLLGAYLTEPSH